ncbi:MAG: ferritin family protein [Planctomycetota bacterium]
MGEHGSIEEVLEFAIDREIAANRLYMDLAICTENSNMKKMFEKLAKEELGHKAKIEAMKKSRVIIPTEKVTDLKIADYVVDIEPRPNMDYKDVLIIAMQKENASYCLYIALQMQLKVSPRRIHFYRLLRKKLSINSGLKLNMMMWF